MSRCTTLCNNFSFFKCSKASKLIFCKSIMKSELLRTQHSHCKWKLNKITCKSNHAQICLYLLLSLDWTRLWPMVSLISCNAVWTLGAYTLLFVSYHVISQGCSAALMLVFFPSSSSVSLSLVLGLCGPSLSVAHRWSKPLWGGWAGPGLILIWWYVSSECSLLVWWDGVWQAVSAPSAHIKPWRCAANTAAVFIL